MSFLPSRAMWLWRVLFFGAMQLRALEKAFRASLEGNPISLRIEMWASSSILRKMQVLRLRCASLRMTRLGRNAQDDRVGKKLEAADALFGDELVDADVHDFAEAAEVFAPLFGPVGFVAASEEVVPDVLGLPEID